LDAFKERIKPLDNGWNRNKDEMKKAADETRRGNKPAAKKIIDNLAEGLLPNVGCFQVLTSLMRKRVFFLLHFLQKKLLTKPFQTGNYYYLKCLGIPCRSITNFKWQQNS